MRPAFLALIVGLLAGFGGGAIVADKPKAADPIQTITFPPKTGNWLILPIEAIDGDTIRFYWLVEDRGRLAGINAPELHGAEALAGQAAKLYLTGILPKSPVPARVGVEKYGRVLVDVQMPGGKTLGQLLVEAGHAREWSGQGPRP